VTIKQQHEVRGFLREGDRVLGVTTAADSFEARATVIATGAWSGVVGRLAGVDIPVSPHRRHKFMTAPFPASRIPMATPFIIDPHTNFSLRREGPGLLLGHGRRDEPDGFSTEIDRSLEPALIERAIHRAPALADAELMRAWAGHGPIAGQLMAEMLAHGRAVTMDAGPLDMGRFARGEADVEPLTFV